MRENRRRALLVMGQAGALYALYAVVSVWAFWNLQTDNFDRNLGETFWTRRLYFQVAYVYSMIAFFSLASVFTLYDTALRRRFSESRPHSLIGSCVLLVTDRFVWIRCAVLGGLAALFRFFPPHYFFRAAFVTGKETVEAWLLGALSILLFVFTYLLAVLSTLNWWGMAPRKHVEKRSGVVAFLIQLGYTSVLWVIGGALLAIVLPLTSGFFKLVYRYFVGFLLVALAVWLVCSLIRYARVMLARKRVLRGLARECRRQGLAFSVDGHPYLDLLYRTGACTVTIRDEKSTYVCRLIGGMQGKNPFYLREDGNAEYTRFYVWWSHVITERYFFEADAEERKILLICPCRGRVYAKDDAAERALYSGDRAMGYTVYAGEDFLHAIERKNVKT